MSARELRAERLLSLLVVIVLLLATVVGPRLAQVAAGAVP